jgi:hypothetical protein
MVSEFQLPAGTASSSVPSANSSEGSTTPSYKRSSGLGIGAKEGIAIGPVLGAALIVALRLVDFRRRRQKMKDAEAV